jgi:hypothetical protein
MVGELASNCLDFLGISSQPSILRFLQALFCNSPVLITDPWIVREVLLVVLHPPNSGSCITGTNKNNNLIRTSGNECIDDKVGNDKIECLAGNDKLSQIVCPTV